MPRLRQLRRRDGRWFDPRMWFVNLLLRLAYALNAEEAEAAYQEEFGDDFKEKHSRD